MFKVRFAVLNAFAGFKTFNRSAPFKMLGCSDHDVGEVEVPEVPISSSVAAFRSLFRFNKQLVQSLEFDELPGLAIALAPEQQWAWERTFTAEARSSQTSNLFD
jgi:hypothetical protein